MTRSALPADPAGILELSHIVRIALRCDSAEQGTIRIELRIGSDERVRHVVRLHPQLEAEPLADLELLGQRQVEALDVWAFEAVPLKRIGAAREGRQAGDLGRVKRSVARRAVNRRIGGDQSAPQAEIL